MPRVPFIHVLLLFLLFPVFPKALAEETPGERPVSQCQMIASRLPAATLVRLSGDAPLMAQADGGQPVRITYVGHSTFFIETPGGVKIATDYNGWFKTPALPTVVTMNHAHSSHYTPSPDPAIAHVLRGWRDDGEPADHDLVVGDTYVRNVVSDIRSWGGAVEKNGNSIFIFEVAGLCIGHLGHLHFELTDQQYAEIGRLDVLMVPVDGGLTMGAESMSRVVKRLHSMLILPMHRRGPPIDRFLSMFGDDFDRVFADTATIEVSIRTLPRRPTIHILQGV